MKGTISVNPTFKSLNIQKPQVYLIDPLLVWDSHRLYFRDQKTFIKWQTKTIINATFSKQYQVILLMCQDSRVYILTENLQTITKISWQPKYSVGFQLVQKLNLFIMIGVGQVQILRMNIISNIKSTNFISSMKFQIAKDQYIICDQSSKLKWNKGYGYSLSQNLLYVWSLQDINFYSLTKLQLKSQIRNVTRKQNPITCMFYNVFYKYSITGLINGQIKVWRLPMNHLLSANDTNSYLLIHTYTHHSKNIENIIEGVDHRMIISSSTDMNVCLWSLETFELLRVYHFFGQYSHIMLNNCFSAFAIKDNSLGYLKFGKVMDFITQISSEIINYDKHRFKSSIKGFYPIDSIQLTLGSNIGFRIQTANLNLKDLNKMQIEYVYPPLKAKGIKQIISCPYQTNKFYLLVQSGELFRIRMQDKSGKIEKSYHIEKAQDKQQYPLNQNPTLIKFLKLTPMVFDSQIIQNTSKKNDQKLSNIEDQYQRNKLITIGCNKGSIVFISIDNFQKIYTRITYHREAIIQIQSFYKQQSQNSYLVSLCQEYCIKIVKFDYSNQIAQCIVSLNGSSKIQFMRGFDDRLAIVLEKGMFQIFEFNEYENKLCTIKNHEAINHEDTIFSLDYEPKNKLILTASTDNIIKIWSYYKLLIYQIVLDQGLKMALWTENLEIMVSHNLKLLYIRDIGLHFKQGEIQAINQAFLSENYQSVDLQQILKMLDATQYQQFEIQKQKDYQKNSYNVKKMQEKLISLKKKSIIQKQPKKQKTFIVNKVTKSKSMYQQPQKRSLITDADLDAMNKHIEELRKVKNQINKSILPKIQPKATDNIFDSFMKEKLIKKKVLTRRDITLNRIIMKNIIKQSFGNDQEILSNLKLDF